MEVFWTKDYRVINAVCKPESCFLSVLLKSVSILIQPRTLKASVLSPACSFHNKNYVSINFSWMCCHICRNSVLTELLFPEQQCLKKSKETSFKSEEHPMIQKGLLSICCQCSHLSLCTLSTLKNTNWAWTRCFRQSKPHIHTAATVNFIKKISVCQLNCNDFTDFPIYL